MSDMNAMMSAVSDLGIDVNSLDADSDIETSDTESTEAISEEKPEETAPIEGDQEASEEPATPDSEEKPVTEPVEETASEQPKTAKEVEEINTLRTELEARFKLLEESKANMEKEFQQKYHEKVKTHDEMDAFFAHIANKDPEFFELIKAEFQEHQKHYSNPVLDQTRQELQSIKQELEGFKTRTSDEVTRTKLDAEMNQLKSTIGKEAEAAGLKPEWAKVEDVWADNPKLNLEQAFYAIYGKQIATAKESKAKVQLAEKKVQAVPKVATAGSVSRSNSSAKPTGPMSAFDAVKHFAREATGRSF